MHKYFLSNFYIIHTNCINGNLTQRTRDITVGLLVIFRVPVNQCIIWYSSRWCSHLNWYKMLILCLIFCNIESLMNLYYLYRVFKLLSFQQLSLEFQINIFCDIVFSLSLFLFAAYIILSIVEYLLCKVLVIVMCCCQSKWVCIFLPFNWSIPCSNV